MHVCNHVDENNASLMEAGPACIRGILSTCMLMKLMFWLYSCLSRSWVDEMNVTQIETLLMKGLFMNYNSLLNTVFEFPGGLNPLPHLADPPTSGQNSTPGGRVLNLHLSFAEVGMLFPSHFLLMQFLKYLLCDDLNVTTILIHIED